MRAEVARRRLRLAKGLVLIIAATDEHAPQSWDVCTEDDRVTALKMAEGMMMIWNALKND